MVRLLNTTIRVYHSPDYVVEGRYDTTRKSALVMRHLVDDPVEHLQVWEPLPVTVSTLSEVHDPTYVNSVVNGVRSTAVGSGVDSVRSVLSSTGGVVAAVEHVLRCGGTAGSLSSGLHHAGYDYGHGFCTFNGLAVAAHTARRSGARRVVVVDLDAHCGGGTASLIRRMRDGGLDGIEQVDVATNGFDSYDSDETCRLTISRHGDYLDDVARALSSVDDPSSIDLVIYNAGMDVHQMDSGRPGIDTDVLRVREEMVFSWTRSNHVPIAWVLAGGYESGSGWTLDDVAGLHRMTIEAAVRNYSR